MTIEQTKIISQMQQWQYQKEKSIPDSSYYYYCFGVEQGLKISLGIIEKEREIKNEKTRT